MLPPISREGRPNWQTPKWLFEKLNQRFKFKLDATPPDHSFDGLTVPWITWTYWNPPYREIERWVMKALYEMLFRHFSVALLPVWTDRYWWTLIKKEIDITSKVEWIEGRLKFDDRPKGAPFSSMIVIFDDIT